MTSRGTLQHLVKDGKELFYWRDPLPARFLVSPLPVARPKLSLIRNRPLLARILTTVVSSRRSLFWPPKTVVAIGRHHGPQPAQLLASTASSQRNVRLPKDDIRNRPWWHEFWPTRSLATTVSGQRSFQPAQLPATKADIHGFRPAQRPDDMQNRPLVARILSSAVSCRQG
ncbi:hypothetical protein HYQ46_005211 [Verticillium longisporum]|nr:hypothetical protein HYQ46_005211 [Verticillium longisporum]